MLLRVLLVWISGFLAVSQGQGSACMSGYDDQCPGGFKMELGGQCVKVPSKKTTFKKTETACESEGGRLVSMDDLTDSIMGCLKELHPHPKYKMVWLMGRDQCSLYDLVNKSIRRPGCNKKRYFACIKDALPEPTPEKEITTTTAYITTTTTTTTTSTATATTAAAPIMTERTSTDAPTSSSMEEQTTKSMPVGRQTSTPVISSSSSSSRDPYVTTFILTPKNTSTDGPSNSDVTFVHKPTNQDSLTPMKDYKDSSTDLSAKPTPVPGEDSTSSEADSKPMLTSQCQSPTDPAVCPEGWQAVSSNLCQALYLDMIKNLSDATESCVGEGGELMKEEYLNENIKSCLREQMTSDSNQILRLADKKCLIGIELTDCSPKTKLAYICAIHHGKTGKSRSKAAPIAGITLGVTGAAILVSVLVH